MINHVDQVAVFYRFAVRLMAAGTFCVAMILNDAAVGLSGSPQSS
jgi:hypothetical protein